MTRWLLRAVAVLMGATSILVVCAEPQSSMQRMVITVTDQSGQFVGGLRAQDFIITENGVQKGVARFAPDSETPVSVGVLIDTSQSMLTPDMNGRESRWIAAIGATRALLHMLKPQDEFMLMTFDSVISIVQAFTSGHNEIEKIGRAHV